MIHFLLRMLTFGISLIFFTVSAYSQSLPDITINNPHALKDAIEISTAPENMLFTVTVDLTFTSDALNTTTANVFLSRDTNFSSDDLLLAQQTVFSAEDETTLTFDVSAPKEYLGDQQLIIVANPNLLFMESSFENNIATLPFSIVAAENNVDFELSELTLGLNTVNAGSAVEIAYVLETIASSGSFDPEQGFYLSKDTLTDSDDHFLGYQTDVPDYTMFTVPEGTDPGEWNIIIHVDHQDAYLETEENNNLFHIPLVVNPKVPVDLTVKSISPAAAIVSGESVDVNVSFENKDTGSVPGFHFSFYYSEDEAFGSDDFLLYQGEHQAFAGLSETGILAYLIPFADYIPTGTGYLIGVVDDQLTLAESNEQNNTTAIQITILSKPQPDLVFEHLLVNPATIGVGSAFSVQATVLNQGEVASTGFEVTYFLSGDSILSESDRALYPPVTFAGLAPAAVLSNEYIYQIPAASDTGVFVLLAAIDPLDHVKELDETNNDSSFAVSIKAPDLLLVSLETDKAIYGAGYTAEVTLKAGNESDVSAPESEVIYYLSKDQVIDEADYKFLPGTGVGPLGAGITSTELSVSLNLPGNIEAGSYHLIASIDDAQLITETNNDNNTLPAPLEIRLPDLTLKNAIISPGVVAGGNATEARFQIENLEAVNSLGSNIRFFLSANNQFEPELDSIELNAYTFPTGLKGDSITSEILHQLYIPDIIGGDYYVIFFLDADSSLLETDEANNQAAVELKINNADLIIINAEADPISVGIGQSTHVSFNVSNIGDAMSGPVWVSYALHKADDTERLPSESVEFIDNIQAAGNSSKIEFDLVVPVYFEQGQYYITLFADTYDQVIEYDEENNKDSIAIEVAVPDLVAESPLVNPSVVSLGYSTEFEIKVINESDVTSPPAVVSHFLSIDQVLSEDDFFLTYSYLDQIKSSADTTVSTPQVTIPSYFQEGTYYIIFKADGTESIFETNEENNIAVAEITLKAPDLVVSSAESDTEVVGAGSSFEVRARVKNQSETAKAPASILGFYISEDDELDDEDAFINSVQISTLELSSTSSEVIMDFLIPTYFAAGEYSLILLADHNDAINETDETNNTAIIPITIANTDLFIDNLLLSGGVAENGAVITASVDIHNLGEVDANNFQVSFYLSETDTLNQFPISLNQFHIDKLISGADTTLSDQHVSLYLPNNLKGGDYKILAFVDSEFAISETNEENNVVYQNLKINTPDLEISSLETEDITAGSPFDLSFRLKNNESVEVDQPVLVYFYLTRKDTLGAEGNEIRTLSAYTYTQSIVGNGTGDIIELTLNAPIDLDTGQWYLAIYIDLYNTIPETDDLNNLSFEPLTAFGTDIGITTAKIYPEIIQPDMFSQAEIEIKAVFDLFNSSETSLTPPHSNTYIYFSVDNALDENDTLLKIQEDIYINQQDTGDVGNIIIPVNVDIDPGNYHLLFLTDALDTINETNEINNLFAVPLTVDGPDEADLTPVSHTLSLQEVASGRDLSVVTKINNAGKTLAFPYFFSAFLSEDDVLDAGDVELTTRSTTEYFPEDFFSQDAHPVQEIRSFSYDLQVPADVLEGEYSLLTFADSKDTIAEGDETNNQIHEIISVRDPYPVDYSISFTSSLPEVLHAGSGFNFSYHLENLGNGLAQDSVTIGFYLSSDNTWDSSDDWLGGDTATILTPYEIAEFIHEMAIPSQTEPGIYYFVLFADNLESVPEENEGNNISTFEITVEEALPPDLRITNLSAFDTFYPNVSTTVRADVQNIGKGPASDIKVSFYLSENNIWSTEDRKLQDFELDLIRQGGQTHTSQWALYLPLDVELGDYFLIAIADGDDILEESNETNNSFILPIAVGDAQAPDLAVDPVYSLYTIYEGETENTNYEISFILANLGNANINDPGFDFYLSFDDVFDQTDIKLDLAYDPLVFISVFSSYQYYFPIIFPDNLIAGEYTLFIQGDPENNMVEFDEENNLAFLTLVVNPPSKSDLSFEGLFTTTNEINANTLLQVNYSLTNLDRAPVSGAMVSFYLSKDPTLSEEDLLIGEDSIGYLYAYGSNDYITDVFINRSTPIGTYYLLGKADPENQIQESDENNNLGGTVIAILEPVDPNMTMVSLSVPESVKANSIVAFNGSLYNSTAGSAIDVQLSLFLSEDEHVDSEDALVYNENIGNIYGGSYLDFTGQLIVPEQFAYTGTYLLAVLDPENAILETNEEDNIHQVILAVEEPVYPDLLISGVSGLIDFIHAGQTEDFSLSIQNASEGFAGNFTVKGYLSDDATLDENDLQVMELENNENLSAGIYDYVATLSPDGSVTPGTYTFILSVDDTQLVEEVDETNNTFNSSITIGDPIYPDFVVSSVLANPQEVNAALETTLSVEVSNVGLAPSGESILSFYLSSNTIWESADQLLGSESISVLEPGAGKTMLSSVIIPGSTTPGSYYIVAVADQEHLISEVDETNNEGFKAIEVLERLYPDLIVTSGAATPNPVNAGLTTTISFSIKNTGEAPAAASTAGIYISSNDTWDSNDELLGTTSVSEVDQNESVLGQASLEIPVETSPGNYFIIVKANQNGAVVESDDTNNAHSLAIEVLEKLYPDLLIDNLSLSNTSISAGTNATLAFDIINTGEVASAASTVRVYLSDDNVSDNGDEEVGSQSIEAINANGTASISVFAKVPVTTLEGAHFFLIKADADNAVQESDESNNESAVSVTVNPPLPSDLTITELSLSEPTSPLGGSVTVNATIRNLAANDALTSMLAFYISSDEVLDNVDVLLGTEETDILKAETSVNASVSVVIPSAMLAGDYYVIALADAEEVLDESDEGNNSLSTAIELVEPLGIETEGGLLIYPNPVNSHLYISHLNEFTGKMLDIRIFALDGRLVTATTQQVTSGIISIPMESLETGNYVILLNGGGLEVEERIFKN